MTPKKKKKIDTSHINALTEYKHVGPSTAKTLLNAFHTTEEVLSQDQDSIKTVLGDKTGAKVYQVFHKEEPTEEEIQQLTEYKFIGKERAKELISHFGSAEKVLQSGMPAIQNVLGEKMGVKVFESFHGEDAPKVKQTKDSNVGRKPEYSDELAESIADDYAKGTGTVAEIMEKYGLTERTFYYWMEEKLQFFQAIKKARAQRNGRKLQMALTGMERLLQGGSYKEQQTEVVPEKQKDGTVKNVVQKTTVTEKHVLPNVTMTIFALVNLSKGDFKHVSHVKHEDVDEVAPYDLSNLTTEELKLWEKLTQKVSQNGSE